MVNVKKIIRNYIYNMKIEEILKENNNKIFFLKAILLGIKYGESKNNNFYKENIKNEIMNLQKNKPGSNSVNINNIEDNFKNISKKIVELENLRNNIIKNINNLSYNNYNNNYLKINSLRNNLLNINNEIENLRNKLLPIIKNKSNKFNIKKKY